MAAAILPSAWETLLRAATRCSASTVEANLLPPEHFGSVLALNSGPHVSGSVFARHRIGA